MIYEKERVGRATAVIGLQYGSEGKGAISEYLAPAASSVVRIGAANAGHTVMYKGNLSIDSSNQKQYGNPINKIMETSQYKDFVNLAIENAKNGQAVTPGSLRFDKSDLYTAMHRANIQVSVENTKDNWVVNTTISDTYDFNPVKPETYKGAATRLPAAQAYKDQGSGILSNYGVNIKFSDKIKK